MKKTLLLLTAISLFSCGTLKKNIEKEETETEVKTESNTTLDYEKNSFTLEPINLERPILVGGKEYYNTKVIYQKESGKETKQENTEVKQETETLHKEIERDNTTLFLGIAGVICFFLFLIVLVILWYINKKLTI
jgi:hypothetical protein